MIDRTRLAAASAVMLALGGCGLITPRDEEYFRFHAEEAKLVVTRCERGQETGSDCEAASQAVAAINREIRDTSNKGAR